MRSGMSKNLNNDERSLSPIGRWGSMVLWACLAAMPVIAFAQSSDEEKPSQAATSAKTDDDDAAANAAKPAAKPKPTRATFSLNAGELTVLKKLAERRQQLDARESALVDRERIAKAMETRLAAQALDLKKLQATLDAQATEIEKAKAGDSDADKERLARLAKAYKAMKPKDAARLFNTMDMSMLAPIAREISPRALAPVLARMNAKKATALSQELRRK